MPLVGLHRRKKSKGSGTTGLLADPTQGHGVEHPELWDNPCNPEAAELVHLRQALGG